MMNGVIYIMNILEYVDWIFDNYYKQPKKKGANVKELEGFLKRGEIENDNMYSRAGNHKISVDVPNKKISLDEIKAASNNPKPYDELYKKNCGCNRCLNADVMKFIDLDEIARDIDKKTDFGDFIKQVEHEKEMFDFEDADMAMVYGGYLMASRLYDADLIDEDVYNSITSFCSKFMLVD